MRTTSSLREWMFALGIVAALSAATYYLVGDRLQGSTASTSAVSQLAHAKPGAGSGAIITREHGQCRQVTFDKATGEIKDNSLGPCPNTIGMTANSTEGRVLSIRQTFSGR